MRRSSESASRDAIWALAAAGATATTTASSVRRRLNIDQCPAAKEDAEGPRVRDEELRGANDRAARPGNRLSGEAERSDHDRQREQHGPRAAAGRIPQGEHARVCEPGRKQRSARKRAGVAVKTWR